MDDLILLSVASGALRSGTPLLLAALGELVHQKSGVLNLNIEGLMLLGALTGFAVCSWTANPLLATFAAATAGAIMMAAQGALGVFLGANQIATGLAFVLFSQGVTAFFGAPWVGVRLEPGIYDFARAEIGGVSALGVLLGQDGFTFATWGLAGATWFYLTRTKAGLRLRACGDDPRAATGIGLNVRRTRLCAGLYSGAICALAGAYISIFYAGQWQEDMVAGRGWIALVLIMFSMWRPIRLIFAAILFGGLTSLHLNLQAIGSTLSPHLLGMLPFLGTIIMLPIAARMASRSVADYPASLGQPLDRDH